MKNILRQELAFQGIVFSDDLHMSGAARSGDIDERAAVAIGAGCDIILLCNDRSGTERLLSSFRAPVEPVTQVRLMRMHGKGHPGPLDQLLNDRRWITATESIGKIRQTQAQELDLGDDMPA